LSLYFSVASAPSCLKIIIVWQDQSKPRPHIDELPNVGIPIILAKTKKNVLSNRFFPYPEIKTSCVLAIDDDIDFITKDEFEFGYQMWRSVPDRLIGWPSRLHYRRGREWYYDATWTNDVSLGNIL